MKEILQSNAEHIMADREVKFKVLLDVEDVVYGVNKHGVQIRYVIDRVTTTKAYAGERKFKREIGDNDMIHLSGESSSYSAIDYYLSNERLDEEWYRKKTLERLERFKFVDLPTNRLKELISFLNDSLTEVSDN